jgi:hypothetical protein
MAKKGKNKYVPAPAFLLDTNVLHYARLYLELAEKNGLYPVVIDADPIVFIKGKFQAGSKTCKNIIKGFNLIKYLRAQVTKKEAQVDYCPISKLELKCGLLKGESILNAAKEKIPSRMWRITDHDEIADRLIGNGFSKIKKQFTRFEKLFGKAGIPLNRVGPDTMPEIWNVADELYSFVYLDTCDCIIYATALISQTDRIITDDGYFRRLVANIHNPGAAPEMKKTYFSKTHENVKNVVSKARKIPKSEVILPAISPSGDWEKAPLNGLKTQERT